MSLIWARTRHTTGCRRVAGVLPAALEAFEDLADRRRAAIRPCPKPRRCEAPEPGQDQGSAQSRWAPTQPRYPSKQIQEKLRTEQLTAHAAVTAAFGASTAPRRHHRRTQSPDRRSRSRVGDYILRHTRTPTSTAPCQDLVSSSRRVLGESGPTRTGTPHSQVSQDYAEPHHDRSRRPPQTRRVGPLRRNRRLYDAVDQWPSAALQSSPGARAFYANTAPPATCIMSIFARPGQPPRRDPAWMPSATHSTYDEHTAWRTANPQGRLTGPYEGLGCLTGKPQGSPKVRVFAAHLRFAVQTPVRSAFFTYVRCIFGGFPQW